MPIPDPLDPKLVSSDVQLDMPFTLPIAPESLTGPVKAWSAPIMLPTYLPAAGDRNPMFLDRRVYQGSSGRVYPLPFIDRIASKPEMRLWQAIHIENEYIRVMIMPEIGGRIHVGFDKVNGYDFFYRQNVIKPALVGLAGPWISGGVELNWPQHHRPATFMPVSIHIQESADGARTVWCSDHDPLTRMKGMHGVCLYPGRSYIELKVRLFNRTPQTQTFLWWANAAVHVDEHYQSFFPPDVHYIADHARRSINTYPLATEPYYGVDYPARVRFGVPVAEQPARFRPHDTCPPNDLRWYANIPVPTSYMAVASQDDFFGGYHHAKQAGLVHVADHRIAPGKKQWTWGNQDFGYSWDRNLTDRDGPYVELMAGVYTDNQPDFSFLAPYETRTFSQFWYPIPGIGIPQKATVDAAARIDVHEQTATLSLAVTSVFQQLSVTLSWRDLTIGNWTRDLAPGQIFREQAALPAPDLQTELLLRVKTSHGRELLQLTLAPHSSALPADKPTPASEPLPPRKVETTEELYLIGLHLAQYRHPTRHPEAYWLEALHRHPADVRCNLELGRQHLERGEFIEAEQRLRRSVAALTTWNKNPADGEPFYLLAICLRYLGRDDEAYDAFFKATWNFAWRPASLYAIAELDVKAGRWEVAPKHLYEALRLNADNNHVRNLAVAVFRRFHRSEQAQALLAETLALDPLDAWANQLAGRPIQGDNQTRLDIAFDYLRAGLYSSAIEVLTAADVFTLDGSVPMVLYTLAYAYRQSGDLDAASQAQQEARMASSDRCFPNRLDELLVLENAVLFDPTDARAFLYLGNWLYAHRRHEQALDCWEITTRLQPEMATAWRNLGMGLLNASGDAQAALEAYERAFLADPSDARVFYERDQLWKRAGTSSHDRLSEFRKHRQLVDTRDDLSLELATLHNLANDPDLAATVLRNRVFQPWEGGEGSVLDQYVHTQLSLGKRALQAGSPTTAHQLFEQAFHVPANLGEVRHPTSSHAEIHFWLGEAHSAAGNLDAARKHWQAAAAPKQLSEQTLYSALSLSRLGERREARNLLRQLWFYGRKFARDKGAPDYFATSLPALLLFEEDLARHNRIRGLFLQTQARFGLGQAKLAAKALAQLLQLDPNHQGALELSRDASLSLV